MSLSPGYWIAFGDDETRRYYCASWGERSWWISYWHDEAVGWLRSDPRSLAVGIMPTTYRTLGEAIVALEHIRETFTRPVFVVNATSHIFVATAGVRACRVCCCTDDRACVDERDQSCSWVDDPEGLGALCSACLDTVHTQVAS